MTTLTTMSIGARIAFTVFTLGFVFNFAETWYYGWNWSAGSQGESACNALSGFLIMLGLGMQIYYRNWGGG